MIRVLCLVLTAFVLLAPGLQANEEYREPVDFTLQELHGEAVSLSTFRQKWVVINYWATWCAPCRKEIPELSSLHEANDDIVVLGLAYEDTDIGSFDEFLEEYLPSYQILLVDVSVPPAPFGAPKVLPTTIILNPEGYPVKTFLGPVTREELESFIDSE
jgi:thiol-disulfide isomerase/thioredoxin